MVNDYAGLFGLLDDERMSWFAISRMVLQAMSIAQGTWWDYLSTALSALSLWEWALLLLSLFFAYGSRRIWKYAATACSCCISWRSASCFCCASLELAAGGHRRAAHDRHAQRRGLPRPLARGVLQCRGRQQYRRAARASHRGQRRGRREDQV
ncbi:MAG: hypothetical protein ACLVJ6_11160 [Merdibacter sp.]